MVSDLVNTWRKNSYCSSVYCRKIQIFQQKVKAIHRKNRQNKTKTSIANAELGNTAGH